MKAGDLALTENFDCVTIEKVDKNVAECRYFYDHKGEEKINVPMSKLIQFTSETAEKARKHLSRKLGKLNSQLSEIDDCLRYVA